MLSMRATLVGIFLFASLAITSQAAEQPVKWPQTTYDQNIPSIADVLGYPVGTKITWSHDVRRYFEALQAAAPERVTLQEMARSWEGRSVFYAAITSPKNTAKLADIKAGMHALRDPGTPSERVDELLAELPAVTWLAYGVHGNEISSTDAAMKTAHHLLAAQDDPGVQAILESTVVVLVPMQNPDGRDRFIHAFENARGLEPSSDRLSAEHDESWPGGRTNHYLFDMNRDWFIRTQPEVIGHADAVGEWLPVAFADLHEMGSDSTYFFAPEAVPYNPHLAADQRASLHTFGRNNAKTFDEFGIDYFTREVYDAFYPGYGASWPAYLGSVAMTYEQASARGLIVRRYDGSEMPFAQTVRNHFLTSITTAETVARNRQQLLSEFREYQLSAIAEGRKEATRSFIIPTQTDQDGADRMGALLAAQGIKVERALDTFKACGRDFDAGSQIINLDQPAKRMIRTLLDKKVPMEDAFVAEQERLHRKNLPDEMYDITAWSLPLLFNVETISCGRLVSVPTTAVHGTVQTDTTTLAKAGVAYIVPWGERDAVELLSHALRAGLKVKSSDRGFTLDGQDYPAGTLIIDVASNPNDLHQQLSAFVSQTGADVVAADDSWVTDGPSFGSRKVMNMIAPRIALAWDKPVSPYSTGNFRYVVERQFGYPVTNIRTARLQSADLERYDVLVLPDMDSRQFLDMLGDKGLENLTGWVRRGGVIIALGQGTRALADPAFALLPTEREYRWLETDSEARSSSPDEAPSGRTEGTVLDGDSYGDTLVMREAEPASVGGAILNTVVDPDHWLAAGVAAELPVLTRSAEVYTPLALNEGVNVVRYADAETLVASGHVWEVTRRQLAYKPAVMARALGRGQVIAFTHDPTVRAYQDGLNVLVANALFRGPAHARPVR